MVPVQNQTIPSWLLRPLPLNAVSNEEAIADLDRRAADLPKSIWRMSGVVSGRVGFADYDALANHASALVWKRLNDCIDQIPDGLFSFAKSHFTIQAKLRVIRRLARHKDPRVRRLVRTYLSSHTVREVSLPAKPDGAWDAQGWIRPADSTRVTLTRTRKVKAPASDLPRLKSVRAIMKEFGIVSERQLGWLLTATDEGDGPYTSFEVGKRNGQKRKICAPKWQLRRIQQQILHKILDHVPVHPAAHGFVRGRSVVTNAAPHQQKALILKFDLADFFPTIHYLRVMGLFASLGYGMSKLFFSTSPKSRNVVPVLARLCSYTEDPTVYREGFLPQGAPTSPAISNLICRRLDARLSGLAEKCGANYTRYADDLTFSFANAEAEELQVGRFRWWVDQICHQEGFFVNQTKFRAIRPSQRQSVTGIVVNDRMTVPREIRRRFRAMLHNLRTKGFETASRGEPGFGSHLLGLASYMHMVDPDQGRKQLDEVRALLGDGADSR